MPGAYRPDAEDPAEAHALAEPLWELALAAGHYHPHVASSSQSIASIPPEGDLPCCGCPLRIVSMLPCLQLVRYPGAFGVMVSHVFGQASLSNLKDIRARYGR